MVVRFPPQSPHDDSPDKDLREKDSPEMDSPSSGATGDGSSTLAPVTPLRRAVRTSQQRDPGAHPSRRRASTADGEGAARVGERPVALLPGVSEVQGTSEARGRSGASGWNNTWAEEPASGVSSSSPPSSPSTPEEPGDGEIERLTRKTTAVTIRQLTRRGISRWELEQLLTKQEIAAEVFAPELDRLQAMGVIDDASLAASLAFTQHSRKGLGRSAIEQDLKRRHIEPELIEQALADIAEEDELERATELAVKRIGQLSSYDDETVRRRLHGFLARKGYASGVVRQAMDAAFASRNGRGVRFQ